MAEFSSPQTVNSSETVHSSAPSVQVVDSSTSSVQILVPTMPVISDHVENVDSSYRSATVEHVISSPRDSISSVELDVLEARAEATRAAQQAAEARLRYLEARARSTRTSQASRSLRADDLDRWERALDPRVQAELHHDNYINPRDFILPMADNGAGVGSGLHTPDDRDRAARHEARRDRQDPRDLPHRRPEHHGDAGHRDDLARRGLEALRRRNQEPENRPRQHPEPHDDADRRDDPVRRELEDLRRRNLELEKIVSTGLNRGSTGSAEHSAYLTPGELKNAEADQKKKMQQDQGRPTSVADDLVDVFKNEAGGPTRVAASENFATPTTPRDIPDLIDLGTPPKAQGSAGKDDARHPSDANHEKTIKEIQSQIAELGDLIMMNMYPATSSPVLPPPGLPNPSGANAKDTTRAEDLQDDQFEDMFVRKVTVKEADSIKLNQLPEVPMFIAWKQHVRAKVVSASGRGEEAFRWIRRAEDESVNFHDLRASGDFASTDAKLHSAIKDVAKGRIGTLITREVEEAAEKGIMLSGRQLYRLVIMEYQMEKGKAQIHDMADLQALVFPGDEHLQMFLDNWNETISGLHRSQPDEILEQFLFTLINSSQKLSAARNRYLLARPGDYERSYQFLHDSLTTYVRMEHDAKLRAEVVKARDRRMNVKPKFAAPAQQEDSVEEPMIATPAQPAAPKQKNMPPCFRFQSGLCNRGNSCRFAHTKLNTVELKTLTDKMARTPCRMHAAGQCRFGDKCHFSHE